MLYSGTDPESYISEYTLVYEDTVCTEGRIEANAPDTPPDRETSRDGFIQLATATCAKHETSPLISYRNTYNL